MKVKIYPSIASGSITVPSSKSIAHRALICASLANGESKITNLTFNSDVSSTISGLTALGATFRYDEDKNLYVKGINTSNHSLGTSFFNANDCGTTLRTLLPLFSVFGKDVKIFGSKRLLSRPLDCYKKIYKENLVITNEYVCTKTNIKSGEYDIDGSISSQFISGLLFTLPLLDGDSKLNIIPPFVSKSYVDLTILMLKKFGIEIDQVGRYTFIIPGNQRYQATNVSIEGDYSSAAFFLGLGAINGSVEVKGLNINSIQSDKAIADDLALMNARINKTLDSFKTSKSNLVGATIDIDNTPDSGPILFAIASLASSNTTILNTKRLRIKESDRLASMQNELAKFGVKMDVLDNEVIIHPIGKKTLNVRKVIECHNDHRVCMALAVLGTVTKKGIILDGFECVEKSYPNFLDDLKKVGIKAEIIL